MSYSWEPYDGGYIIAHAGGGRHVATVCEVALIREVERLERLLLDGRAHRLLADFQPKSEEE